jgi:hypothetical protein
MIATLMALWLALIVAGDTPIGRWLRGMLVTWPARKLARVSRGAVLTWLVLAMGGAALFWLMQDEGLRLYSMMLPDLAAAASAMELGTLVDTLAAVLLTVATIRVDALRGWLGQRRPGRRRARRNERATRRDGGAANDDDDRARGLAA